MVIFTADHGDLVGSDGLGQKGALVYDENFHVPLIVVHPDMAGKSHSTVLASEVDLAPSLLDMAGLDAPARATCGRALRRQRRGPVRPRQ